MKKIQNKTILEVEQLEGICDEILSRKDITHGMGRALRNLKKEILVFRSHKNTRSINFDYKDKMLQIGGGKHVLEGFINIDIFPPADIILDVREGIPLDDKSIKFIFTEHFLEHIDYPISAKRFVTECFRILKNKGDMVIGVPDSEQIIKAYVNKDKNFYMQMVSKWYKNRTILEHFNTYMDLVNYHFRDQDDDLKYNPHFWGYDFEKLSSLLKGAGFSKVEKWNFDPKLANPDREFGSTYVIATKQ